FGVLKELARTRRRNADQVVARIGRTRVGQRTFKCVLLIGTRSAQSIMASGFTAAQTGRTHDRTRPMLQLGQKVLAKAPSTHDPKRTLAFLGHLVLYEPNDRCDDRPSDAAANCLTEESTNIHAAGCIAQNRQKREDLTSDAASDCARDRVARRAEAQVLRRRAHCIATECTGYNLNYDVDEYPRHMSLPCPQNGRLGYFILSALES